MEPVFVDLGFDPAETADPAALRERVRRLEEVLANAQEIANMGGWEWLLGDGRVVCSEPMCDILGVDGPGAVPDPGSFMDLVHAEDRLRVGREVQAALAEGWDRPLQFRIVRPDGEVRWIEAHAKVEFDDDGTPVRVWGTGQDITSHRRLEAEVERRTVTDALTGLLTREAFRRRLDRSLDDLTDGAVVVAVTDLDGFKRVNEQHGMAAGDELLRTVARRLETALPEGGAAARLAGDVFAVTYRGTAGDRDTLRGAARWIRRVVVAPGGSAGQRQVQTSVGIAAATDTSHTSDRLLADAEAALDLAKTRGPGTCQVYDPVAHQEALDRRALAEDLRAALADGALDVVFQPVVHLETGTVLGVEALARWHRRGHGPVPPGVFVPVAEHEGLVSRLDAQVLATATTRLAAWRERIPAARDLNLGVNISAAGLDRADMLATVQEALEWSGLPAGRLILELTETAVTGEPGGVVGALEELRGWGVRIALDDFGTGYSSMGRLRDLPLDMLKIDRSLIRDVRGPDDRAPMLSALTTMARRLGLGCVIEGIETPGQLAAALRHGDDAGQGYLLGRPATAADIEPLLAHPSLDTNRLRGSG